MHSSSLFYQKDISRNVKCHKAQVTPLSWSCEVVYIFTGERRKQKEEKNGRVRKVPHCLDVCDKMNLHIHLKCTKVNKVIPVT